MANLNMSEAFRSYGAIQKNVNWSVSAWSPDGSLVVSLWAHHYRKGPSGTAEYASTADRPWHGPGRNEFVSNVQLAFDEKRRVRLIVVSTDDPDAVETGRNVNTLKKSFDPKHDQIGEIVEFDGSNYVFRFRKA